MGDAGIVSRVDAPLPGKFAIVVGRQGLLMMRTRARELATRTEQCHSRHEERFHEHAGVIHPLGKRHPLRGQLLGEADVTAHQTPFPVRA